MTTAVVHPAAVRRRVTGTVKPPLRTAVRWTGQGLARGLLQLTVEGSGHVPAQGPVLLGAPVVPIAVLGSAPARTTLPRLGAPVRVVFGSPVHVAPTGDPRARRTVRDAAEQLRLALLAHLHTSSTEERT